MNNCNFVGNLTEDVKLTSVNLPDGTSKSKATFTLAVNDHRREEADFIDFTVWGNTAENVAKYLKKGMPAAVEAHVKNNVYEKDGVKIYTYQFTADSVQFISAPKAADKN